MPELPDDKPQITASMELETVQQSLRNYQAAGGVSYVLALPDNQTAIVLDDVVWCGVHGILSLGAVCRHCQTGIEPTRKQRKAKVVR